MKSQIGLIYSGEKPLHFIRSYKKGRKVRQRNRERIRNILDPKTDRLITYCEARIKAVEITNKEKFKRGSVVTLNDLGSDYFKYHWRFDGIDKFIIERYTFCDDWSSPISKETFFDPKQEDKTIGVHYSIIYPCTKDSDIWGKSFIWQGYLTRIGYVKISDIPRWESDQTFFPPFYYKSPRENFKNKKLNDNFIGAVKHHINDNEIVYIPKNIHQRFCYPDREEHRRRLLNFYGSVERMITNSPIHTLDEIIYK